MERMKAVILFCQITYGDEFKGTYECVRRISPYVDYCIIVVEKERPFTDEQKEKLLNFGNVILLEKPFEDNLPQFRNYYLDKAKELRRKHGWRNVWICVSDTDEYYCEELCRDIRKIVSWADENNYNILGINCRERFEVHEWMDRIEKLKEIPIGFRESNYYKLLIFKLCCDELKYEGVGISKTVHEQWKCPIHPWRAVYLPKDKYWYEHAKSTLRIWRNATRNLWCGGGGNNVGELNPYYVKLKKLAFERGIRTWMEFEKFIKGKVDDEFEKFLIECLDAPGTDWGVETREMAKFYFATHPERVTPEILERIKMPPKLTKEQEVEYWIRQCYREILGREPDLDGLEHYKMMILEGKLSKEELPKILRMSQEYVEKFALMREEVRIQVPVKVDIGLTEELIVQALRCSKMWWRIKPRLDIGKFLEDQLGEDGWRELQEWFYMKPRTLKEFVRWMQRKLG